MSSLISYECFQRKMAFYGHAYSVLNESQFNQAMHALNDDLSKVIALSCDMYCEAFNSLREAIKYYSNEGAE